MTYTRTDLIFAVLPWLWLALGTLTCFLLGTLAHKRWVVSRARDVTMAALLLAVVSAGLEFYRNRSLSPAVYFAAGSGRGHLAVASLLIDVFSLSVLITAAVVAAVAVLGQTGILAKWGPRAPYGYGLLLAAVGFCGLLAAQDEMASLVAGVGGLSLCLVGVIALAKTDSKGVEVAYKFGVTSALLTAILCTGLSLVYAITADTDLGGVVGSSVPVAIGLSLTVVALAGLIGALPSPQWIASTGMAVPAGLAGFVISMGVLGIGSALLRIVGSGSVTLVHGWGGMLGTLGCITMIYAGIRAWREDTLRGVISYLVVGQTGAILVAMMSVGAGTDGLNAGGVNVAVLGLVSAALTTATAFSVLSILEHSGVSGDLESARSLFARNNGLAICLAIAIAGLAGVPATAGFVARLLASISASYINHTPIALATIAATAISSMAALRVLALLFQGAAHDIHRLRVHGLRVAAMTSVACSVALVFLVILAGPMLKLGAAAAAAISVR